MIALLNPYRHLTGAIEKLNEVIIEVNRLTEVVEYLQKAQRNLDTRTLPMQVIGGLTTLPKLTGSPESRSQALPDLAPSFFLEEPEKPV